MLVTYTLSHEFSLVSPVGQEYLWSQVFPSWHPSVSRKHLSYVPLEVQEGVTFLPIPIHVSRSHYTPRVFLALLLRFLHS